MKHSCKRFCCAATLGVLTLIHATAGTAETVDVKYRGQVSLATFTCDSIDRSSIVMRLCYDEKERYAIVKLLNTYYHYCEVPADVVAEWRKSESMGRFLNGMIKGRYDCRMFRVPSYANR